jgi:hypothetical protein
MNSKLMLMGAASALLLSHVCGCAVESGSEEDTATQTTSADEKTATVNTPLVSGKSGDKNGKPEDNRGMQGASNGGQEDNAPGYDRYGPTYNQPGYDPRDRRRPGEGNGYGGGNSQAYNPYAPGSNPPGYYPPGSGPDDGASYGRRDPRGYPPGAY